MTETHIYRHTFCKNPFLSSKNPKTNIPKISQNVFPNHCILRLYLSIVYYKIYKIPTTVLVLEALNPILGKHTNFSDPNFIIVRAVFVKNEPIFLSFLPKKGIGFEIFSKTVLVRLFWPVRSLCCEFGRNKLLISFSPDRQTFYKKTRLQN